jgi:hypothetical protein
MINPENDPKLEKLRHVTPTVTHKGITFIDAQSLKKTRSDFYAPSVKDLNNLEVGDYIKVFLECASEHFWVWVKFIDATTIAGTIASNVLPPELKFGDTIEVPDVCIYEIIKAHE